MAKTSPCLQEWRQSVVLTRGECKIVSGPPFLIKRSEDTDVVLTSNSRQRIVRDSGELSKKHIDGRWNHENRSNPINSHHTDTMMLLNNTGPLLLLCGMAACLFNGAALALSTNIRDISNTDRRTFVQTAFSTAIVSSTSPALAINNQKSRSDGYTVQHSEREWAYLLSGAQYNILRQGGTERQKSSILHTFTSSDNVGMYTCAGCEAPLFSSDDKFSSGTGWPSFAAAYPGAVEVEDLDPIRATLDGQEARCAKCGGHLGDVFNDGWIYVRTPAAKTGKRFCIDGAALVFKPADGGLEVLGDLPPPNKFVMYKPAIY
jgi:peptide-methionine (R)-S-oxide reductase